MIPERLPMRVLVTGATGFIGGHAVRALAGTGHEVWALVRPGTDSSGLREARVVRGDLGDVGSLAAACRGAAAVVHAAAVVRGHGDWSHFRAGVDGTNNLLRAMADARVRRLVHLSSLAVYGLAALKESLTESFPLSDRLEGWNHYARQKVLSERAVWDAHARGEIDPVVLRAAATLGPGDRASLPAIFEALRSGKMAVLGSGSNRVPFVVVEDLVRAIADALSTDAGQGRAYNISGALPITQAAFLAACARALGLEPPSRHVPASLARLGAAFTEWTHSLLRRAGQPSISRLGVMVATTDLIVDTSAAKRDLGWVGSGSYQSAIEREVTWLRERSGGPTVSLASSPTIRGTKQ